MSSCLMYEALQNQSSSAPITIMPLAVIAAVILCNSYYIMSDKLCDSDVGISQVQQILKEGVTYLICYGAMMSMQYTSHVPVPVTYIISC